MKTSKGEERVIELLKEGNFKFEREKRFGDLRKGRYRFDFYVQGGPSKNCIIEYQGEQHYRFVSKFHKSYLDLRAAQERDRKKINYCLAHQIPLYIIPYWELDKLTCAADLFKDKYRAYDMWKNDKDYEERVKFERDKREFDMYINYVL